MSTEHDAQCAMRGRASGQGRVFQANRDQYVTEHHHHYPPGEQSLFGPSIHRSVVQVPSAGGRDDWPVPDTVRTPLVGRTPAVLRDRVDLMARLLNAARNETGGIHILHGLGGCGKTAVAQAVFHTVTGAERRVGLWVNASDRATLRAGMLAVAADRGAASSQLAAAYDGRRASADLAWHCLDRSAQPWLLVLDNADDPTVLDEGAWLRSSSQGTVIVTTRQPHSHVWAGAELHGVDVLPVEDAARVLSDLAPETGTVEEAEALARRLGCLPLALTLAGSFLSRQLLESWSMSDYRQQLDDDPIELIDRGANRADLGRNPRQFVSRTWEISLEVLVEQNVPECVTLLRLLSCWGADPVPLSLLVPAAIDAVEARRLEPPLSGAAVEDALRGPLDHSLVSLVETEEAGGVVRSVQAHGVLLDSVAAAVPAEQRGLLMAIAADLLDRAVPADDPKAQTAGNTRVYVPHVVRLLHGMQETTTASLVLRTATRVIGRLFAMGDYRASLSVARTAAESGEALLGADDPANLRVQYWAARNLFRLGKFAASESLHRRVLTARQRLLGPEHRETLESLLDIHEPLGQLNRLDDCLSTMAEVERIRGRRLGDRHPDTLHVRALAIEYLALAGQTDEFDRTGPATVAACEEVLGSDTLTTIVARHNYAFGLYRFGRYVQAEPAARTVLADRERFHGPDHPATLSAAVLLSWILVELGQLTESVALGRRVVAGQEGSLGIDHPYVLVNRTGLATSLARSGEEAEAIELARKNLPLCERVLGADDPVTVSTRALIEEASSGS